MYGTLHQKCSSSTFVKVFWIGDLSFGWRLEKLAETIYDKIFCSFWESMIWFII